jgi:hypothetical protein
MRHLTESAELRSASSTTVRQPATGIGPRRGAGAQERAAATPSMAGISRVQDNRVRDDVGRGDMEEK